ncbi:hypothetical protein BST45_19970 [Mycobacterium shinjukuense]|uniref:Uncharacterized protein n=1 Tax=Mycobacterium shinjukuense TaxID=398694 RepID=A0A7I7MS54_9MYCO|nr:hypothetical protein BST45_19970 [Mycobacterium shinjukuense]BBX74089.1 hypothetical protein MSHI_19950 [Mycobacterium shinjukuense]
MLGEFTFGHTNQLAAVGRALPRLGPPPQTTTLSTATAPPVNAQERLRSGKAASGRGAASQLTQAITPAIAINPDATIMVRGDSMVGIHHRFRLGRAVVLGRWRVQEP